MGLWGPNGDAPQQLHVAQHMIDVRWRRQQGFAMHVKGCGGCSAHEDVRGSTVTVQCIHCMCRIAVTTLRKTLSGTPLKSCMWGVAETGIWLTALSESRKHGRYWVESRCSQMLDDYHLQEDARIAGSYEDSMKAAA